MDGKGKMQYNEYVGRLQQAPILFFPHLNPDGFNPPVEWYIPRRGGYQPPATQRFQPSRLNGMHPRRNVGGDAHIAPNPHATARCVEWDGLNMTFFHSTGRVETVRVRAAGSRPYGCVPFIGARG